MSIYTRVISSRLGISNLMACLRRQPGKDNFFGFGLTRYSTVVPRFGNPETKDGQPRWTPFGKRSIYALIGLGGLGFALAEEEYHVNCAGKKDENCGNQCQDSSCIHKMDKEEEMIEKANRDLEKALKDIKPKAMEATEKALKAYCEAALIMKEFMDAAYCAIEQDGLESPEFEETWCKVYDLAVKRCEKVKDALKKGQCAWELLCRLREIIENGKSCKYTSCNPLLITAEDFLLCAEREMLNARAKMDCVQSDSILVEQYRELIAKFRNDLKAELDSVTDCDLGNDECAKILSLAYKKAMHVQKELALIQVGMGKVPCKQAQTLC